MRAARAEQQLHKHLDQFYVAMKRALARRDESAALSELRVPAYVLDRAASRQESALLTVVRIAAQHRAVLAAFDTATARPREQPTEASADVGTR